MESQGIFSDTPYDALFLSARLSPTESGRICRGMKYGQLCAASQAMSASILNTARSVSLQITSSGVPLAKMRPPRMA